MTSIWSSRPCCWAAASRSSPASIYRVSVTAACATCLDPEPPTWCCPGDEALPGLAELIDELIRMAADRGIEHELGVRVVVVAQDVALAHELEPGGHDLLLRRFGIDTVQGRSVAEPRAGGRHMIQYHEGAARLQCLVDRPVEVGDVEPRYVVKIMVVLGRPDEVHGLGYMEIRDGSLQHGDVVAVMRVSGNRLHGDGLAGLLRRRDELVETSRGTDDPAEDPREVSLARKELRDRQSCMHPRELHAIHGLAQVVTLPVGRRPRRIGHRGRNGLRGPHGSPCGCGTQRE